ncbi:MAG: FAD-dependent oxidoreductase [Acidobacteria bacterium]|nr:FAD-dependent oxidoreductase [Acidobacteriota bacterium]
MSHAYDAIVIGGGPAGSSSAAILAEKGRRVLVLEREKFPRYHIGESLIPYCYFSLERLGMIPKLKASHFVKKYSVQFVSRAGNLSQPFYFSEHLKHEAACTWQVWRSEFDQMLLDNAREKGAEVLEETKVVDFLQDEQGRVVGVKALAKSGEPLEFQAPITIDATGRDSFAMLRNGWRVRDPQLNKIALWTYYEGALRDSGLDEGATTVAALPDRGWFWYIPLPHNTVSVGVVAEKEYLFRDTRDLEDIFAREIGNNQWIEEHLAPGRRTEPLRITGEFSYRSQHCAADGLVLAGDAFGFLDPVFSSGLFLALRSGVLAADAVDEALTVQDVSGARFDAYGRQVRGEIEAMRRLVYAFYDNNFSFGKLLMVHPELQGDVTDCLIGHLTRDFERLFQAVGELVEVPPNLPYGAPLTTAAS